MASVTQDMLYRQSVMRYAEKNGVTAAARFYRKTRQWVHYWKRRYNGTVQSLAYLSRRPKEHPNQHKAEELKLILDMRRRNPKDGLVIFWVKLRLRDYKRTIPALFRVMQRFGLFETRKAKKPKYIAKPYEQMKYPGQRVQVDVKFVPRECMKGIEFGERLYQFTAIDEYSRQRYLEGFKDNSSYSAARFIVNATRYFGFKIECVQTDNGMEFVKHFSDKKGSLTQFQSLLQRLGILHKVIRPFTPRHNGKVERSHRKDNERFYSCHNFYSLDDFNKQLKLYNKDYNAFPMRPLNWFSPNQFLNSFYRNCNI